MSDLWTLSMVSDAASWPALRWTLTALYLATVGLLCVYGLHRYWITWLFYRTRRPTARLARRFDDLPPVTVQLPMYNEAAVAERVIEAACRLAYPREKLQIQVLDDSTDSSAAIARRCCARMRAEGHPVDYLHRTDRVGYKAGALQAGLAEATGELIAVFDADFIPPPGFLKRTVHRFTDPTVGVVQACWAHLNRDHSLLTRGQAVFLDAHFLIEHAARHRSGRWLNFNGTAGIWRRTAIESAGGWQHDTLSEDVDLSYRAQMAGWRIEFLPRVQCPAELPPEIDAFRSQQHRWTKGTIEAAKKLLGPILRSRAPWPVRLEAVVHLTNPVTYPLMLMLLLLIGPAFVLPVRPGVDNAVIGGIMSGSLLLLATCSAGTFFVAGQRQRRRSLAAAVAEVPLLIAVGVGLAVSNSVAVIEALLGRRTPFVRTPKFNHQTGSGGARGGVALGLDRRSFVAAAEIAMAVYLLGCVAAAAVVGGRALFSLPFLLIFAAGYSHIAVARLAAFVERRRPHSTPLPTDAKV